MYEKEAEEYQIKKHHQRLFGHKPVVMKELNTTYKDGAEFGYNKAQEELELKIKKLTQHLEPQPMTALFEQVREEVEVEQKVKKLDKAKEIIKNLIGILEFVDGEQTRELKTVKEAERFLKEGE